MSGMTTATQLETPTDQPSTQWPIAGLFLDALTRRDFEALAACLAPDVRMRAVTPLRELDLHGQDEVSDRFRMWFGDAPEFGMVDASIGGVGSRAYLSWRIQTHGRGGTPVTEVVEQHVFLGCATAATEGAPPVAQPRISAIDLLCSGFQTVGLREEA